VPPTASASSWQWPLPLVQIVPGCQSSKSISTIPRGTICREN
jgi:hypothetical protein